MFAAAPAPQAGRIGFHANGVGVSLRIGRREFA
jgi:hypothetical protein